jgi:hypothetical protein
MTRKRNWRPYVMGGRPMVSEDRATVLDPADSRITEVRIATLPPSSIRRHSHRAGIDPRLRAVDLCFERWAATVGDGSVCPQLARPNLIHASIELGMIALDEHEAKLVDGVVRSSPPWASGFVRAWYRSEKSVKEIAEMLAIRNRQSVYQERILVLGYFLGCLISEGVKLTHTEQA